MNFSPNYGSSKFLVSVLAIVAATFLAYAERDVPSNVLVAAVVGYHAANAYIKGKNGAG